MKLARTLKIGGPTMTVMRFRIKEILISRGEKRPARFQEFPAQTNEEAIEIYRKKEEDVQTWNKVRGKKTNSSFVFEGMEKLDECGNVIEKILDKNGRVLEKIFSQ